MNNQGTAGLNEFCIMAETFKISFFSAVYVQMVRVCRSDNAHPGPEPVERTVELISFNDDIIRVGEDIVGTIILRDTTEKCVTVQVSLVHDVSTHGRCRGLAVCTCHAQTFMFLSQGA